MVFLNSSQIQSIYSKVNDVSWQTDRIISLLLLVVCYAGGIYIGVPNWQSAAFGIFVYVFGVELVGFLWKQITKLSKRS